MNMPRGDRTGPWGQGPMTGRAAGYCSGNDRPGYATVGYGGRGPGFGMGRGFGKGRGGGFGRGYGRGFGFGRGYGFGPGYGRAVPVFYQDYGPVGAPAPFYPGEEVDSETARKNEMEYLENVAEGLKADLEEVKKRLDELKEE